MKPTESQLRQHVPNYARNAENKKGNAEFKGINEQQNYECDSRWKLEK